MILLVNWELFGLRGIRFTAYKQLSSLLRTYDVKRIKLVRTRPGFTRQAKTDQKSTWCPGFKEPRLIKSKKTHTFISTSESVSYKLQKENTSSEYLKGITRLTVSTDLNLIYHILFVRPGFKDSKLYKECIDSLALWSQNFCSFWKPISPILHTQRANNFSKYQVITGLPPVWSHF